MKSNTGYKFNDARPYLLAFVALCLLCSHSKAATPKIVTRDDVPISAYDALATNAAYKCVGAINAGGSLAASGVVIAPNWILTAGHVVEANDRNMNNLLPPTSSRFINFFNGSTVAGSGYGTNEASTNAFRTAEWFPYPDYDTKFFFGGGYDIGLIRIGTVGGVTNYPPAVLYEGTNDIGVVGTWVGYGNTGTGTTGGKNHNGSHRYAAQNMIDADGTAANFWGQSVDPIGRYYRLYTNSPLDGGGRAFLYLAGTNATVREIASDFDKPTEPRTNWFGSPDPLSLEGTTAPGDSGGGVFIDVAGQQQLAGIVSGGFLSPYTLNNAKGYGTQSIDTRVNAFIGWIRDQLDCGSFEGTNDGLIADFDTPALWTVASSTTGSTYATPGASHSVVFNIPARSNSSGGLAYCTYSGCFGGAYWGYGFLYYSAQSPVLTRCTVTFSSDRSNTRLRVRRAGDLTLNLMGHTYSLTSTSPYSPSVVVGQTVDDYPILTITNGILTCSDAAISEHIGDEKRLGDYARVNITGPGAKWVLSDSLFVGGRRTGPGGLGIVTVEPGAQLLVSKTLKLWFYKRYGDLNTPYGQNASMFVENCGTLVLNGGTVAAGALDLHGGVVSGTSTITVTNATTWLGGRFTGAGSLNALGGMTITGGIISNVFNLDWETYSPVYPPPFDWTGVTNFYYDPNCGTPRYFTFDAWSITNHATATFSGTLDLPGTNNARFENLLSATFDAQTDRRLSGSATFHNLGTFRKSAGTNATIVEWVFDNPGTVQVESGTLQLAGLVPQLSSAVLSAGTWNVLNGSTLLPTQGVAVRTNRAVILLDGPSSSFTNINALLANEGSLTIRNGRNFSTLGNFTNSGTLSVGIGSTLSVMGTFCQPPAGTLVMQMSPQEQSARLVFAGPAVLAGQLQVVLTELPMQSQTNELLSFACSTGSFDSIQLPLLSGVTFQTFASPTNLVLVMTRTIPPVITSFSLIDSSNATLTWTGGSPPFTLQMSTNLALGMWQEVGGPTTDTNLSIPITNPAVFYRLLSQ